MKDFNIFCFGFGQVAKNFIDKVDSENFKIKLSVTSRGRTEIKKYKTVVYDNFQFVDGKFDKNIIKKLKEAKYILISIPPINQEDIVIKNFSKIIEGNKFKWITYLSSTGVYGNHNGDWVNEKSKTNPTSINGINRLKAERSWLNLSEKRNLPIQIFRLSGIYSNQNNILTRLKSGSAKIINKKNHFFSRIHVEDIANILFKSLQNLKKKEIYNISDDKPASSEEIALYGSKLLNIRMPETVKLSKTDNKVLKNFYKDSKKVSNKKMKIFFSYELKYPTYIEGLKYIRDNFI
jgi:nucleoside-diphosphate-sugar epimerase